MDLSKALIRLCVVVSILSGPAMAQPGTKPTAEHKVLARDEGTWDATIKTYMPGPTPNRRPPRGPRSTPS